MHLYLHLHLCLYLYPPTATLRLLPRHPEALPQSSPQLLHLPCCSVNSDTTSLLRVALSFPRQLKSILNTQPQQLTEPRSFGDPKCLFHRHGFPAQAHILVRPLLPSSLLPAASSAGRFFRRLKSTTNTDHHPDSIVPITAHAPVEEGLAYRDGYETRGGPVDGHMVTWPFCPGGNDLPEWVRFRLAL